MLALPAAVGHHGGVATQPVRRQATGSRRPAEERVPTERWRTLPTALRPEDMVETVDVSVARGPAEPAGDPGHEFMLRHA